MPTGQTSQARTQQGASRVQTRGLGKCKGVELYTSAIFASAEGRSPFYPVGLRYGVSGVTTKTTTLCKVYIERDATTNVHTLKIKPEDALPEGATLTEVLLPHTIEVNLFPIVDPET